MGLLVTQWDSSKSWAISNTNRSYCRLAGRLYTENFAICDATSLIITLQVYQQNSGKYVCMYISLVRISCHEAIQLSCRFTIKINKIGEVVYSLLVIAQIIAVKLQKYIKSIVGKIDCIIVNNSIIHIGFTSLYLKPDGWISHAKQHHLVL